MTKHDLDKSHTTTRIEALTDGVYAIIMTLLAFDIRLPELDKVALWPALQTLAPILSSYFISFALLGVYWISHRNQFNYIIHIDQTHRWINIFFLCFSALIPFSTEVIGRYRGETLSSVLFGANLMLMSLLLFWSWVHATSQHRLIASDLDPQIIAKGKRRSLFLMAIYVLAIAVAFFTPILSLIMYALVPLIYIFPFLTRFIGFK